MINLLYSFRLHIGRLERCPTCNKIMWNRGYNLHSDLYNKTRSVTYCKKCWKGGGR